MGYLVYAYRPSASFLLLGTMFFFIFYIILNENKNNEALMAAAYIAGAEVFYRMNGAMVFYETGKYSVILFLLIGMFYKGTSAKSIPFWIYLLILIPGIVMASITLDYDVVFRKAIAFNLSGPVCLGVSALYCYYKKISKNQFQTIIIMLLLPLIANMAYLFIFTPTIGEALRSGTNSNYVASGGYGPNQISTVMGLGAFLLCTRLFVVKNKLVNIVDLILMLMMIFRAIVTFSRGGVITALFCVLCFVIIFYYKRNRFEKVKLLNKFFILIISVVSLWSYTALSTEGLITYRYTNRDSAGKLEDDITTGRAELVETELFGFINNPVLGVGVGKAKEIRSEEAGVETASHNEISRLLSEHGMFGMIALLILIFVPIIFWTKFKNNYYFLAFMAFWFLTINHSAMRIALPAFVYGLALLYIVDEKKAPVHRKRLSH
ncbi:O-antigen ligase family protein [Gillisia marina]|uniref:O-antigen ligase family protein n=1 Tax=Gillisia marina TaxID=1167637 RepID=UPI00030FCC36|nr:O-antigen ligase family protein [Gillisia marina]